MRWTAAQREFLEYRGRRVAALGAAGSGKTTLLLERWRHRAGERGADTLLVLCRSRPAADGFLQAALTGFAGATNAMPITTWHGFAFDLLGRHGGPQHLLTAAERWATVRRLLAADRPIDWPACADLLRRTAFVDEVTRAVVRLLRGAVDPKDVLAAARVCGDDGRWADLTDFVERYRRALVARSMIDADGLIADAASLLENPDIRSAEWARWTEILVDDAEAMTPAMRLLLERLDPAMLAAVANPALAIGPLEDCSAGWLATTQWDRTVDFGSGYRNPGPGELVHCRHPASEAEAVAGVLLQARAAGVAWKDMAVLIRSHSDRARSLGRALTRHGIPVEAVAGSAAEEPAVRAIVDFLAWAAGDETALARLMVSPAVDVDPADAHRLLGLVQAGASDPKLTELEQLRDRLAPRIADADPSALIFEVWRALLPGLVPDPDDGPADPATARALDAVVSFISSAARRTAGNPAWTLADELALLDGPDFDHDPWRSPVAATLNVPTAVESGGAVTISTIAAAAGRQWHTVVIAGCLEGELPRLSGFVPFFDPAILDAARARRPNGHVPTVAERRLSSLADERRLFLMAATRATGSLVATAAPRPGQLVSRFVSRWPRRDQPVPTPLVARDSMPPVPLLPTGGVVPVEPDGCLTLSASQLMTYDDCPLRYAYQDALGVRRRSGVSAEIGSLVHATLAEFLDPAGPKDRSWERLEELAEKHWSDEIALYRPVREQARRDIFTMLQEWWEAGVPLDVVAVEFPFDIPVGAHRVRGYIDRVDRVADGIAIVDYKTGSRMPQRDEVDQDLQLAIYHLAAERQPQLQRLGPPVSLELLHLRTGRTSQQVVTDDHAARTETRILDAATRILTEKFEPSVEADCEYCDFRRLCPLQPEGREVGAE